MIYFVVIGLVTAVALKRNPVIILTNIKFKVPWLLIGSLIVQILLEIIAIKSSGQYPGLLSLTFLGVLAGLFINRHLYGVSWVFAGTFLNVSALLLHGGLMPVSEYAMQLSHLEDLGFDADSRHQAMGSSVFWWLGDWIPFLTPIGKNYVLSPGDVLVGIGLILFLVRNSSRRGQS